jgi:hypothetical protein
MDAESLETHEMSSEFCALSVEQVSDMDCICVLSVEQVTDMDCTFASKFATFSAIA